MRRHFFRFMLVGGEAVGLTTTDAEIARRVLNSTWTTNASHYFTPWMELAFDDVDEPLPGGRRGRVNLMHVTLMTHSEIAG